MYSITTTGHKADESGNEERTESGEAQKPKYYSVLDTETHNVLATARNNETLNAIAIEMEDYLTKDRETVLIGDNVVEELSFYGYEIIGHDELLEQ